MACLAALVALALCAACAKPGLEPARIELPPQDASLYLGQSWTCRPQAQQALAHELLGQYFLCWNDPSPDIGGPAMAFELARFQAEPGLGENLLPPPPDWALDLARNADMAGYPNQAWSGLTTDWQHLRLLPTADPSFSDADDADSMAFDRVQQSLLSPNMPVFVHHRSRDGAWLLVRSPIAWGWLPARGVAHLEPDQAERWQQGPFAVIIRDDVALHSPGGRYLFGVGLGCLLPLESPGRLLVALPRHDNRALFATAVAPARATAPYPMPLSAANLAQRINTLLGRPYGWGGMGRNRDCSGTLQDLFRVFGLPLPRNSADQARSGTAVDLRGADAADKEAVIARRGLPGLTLLYMPGHIMLYLGQYHGRAVALHNVWSLRTRDWAWQRGRLLLGRAVITDLTPGAELPQLARPDGLVINRLESMTLLAAPQDLTRP